MLYRCCIGDDDLYTEERERGPQWGPQNVEGFSLEGAGRASEGAGRASDRAERVSEGITAYLFQKKNKTEVINDAYDTRPHIEMQGRI